MHDLVAIGEVMLRLSIPSPARIETVRQLDVQVGGAEANVAAAVARLGLRAAWISAVPANAWGDRIRRELGYEDVVEMEEGVRRAMAWERANPPEGATRWLDFEAENRAYASVRGGG
jgi:2-dehydro-3-deoxygluconokinase